MKITITEIEHTGQDYNKLKYCRSKKLVNLNTYQKLTEYKMKHRRLGKILKKLRPLVTCSTKGGGPIHV